MIFQTTRRPKPIVWKIMVFMVFYWFLRCFVSMGSKNIGKTNVFLKVGVQKHR